MSKPQWICLICAEDFTRKSSGRRHMNNSSIHSKKPNIVRYIDYIIGRIKGDYPPPINPSRLQRRRTNKQHGPHNPTFTHDYNNTLDARAISNSRLDSVNHLNVSLPMANDNNSKKSYLYSDATGQQLPKATYKGQTWFLGESQITLSSKFEEIKRISKPYFSSENLNILLTNLARQVFHDGGNDHIIDQYITKFRQKINQLEAFDYLSSSKRMTGTNTSEQWTQQGTTHNPSFRGVDEVAAIKLAEIEQLLTSRCPPEFVKNVITGLTKQFNMTGDHSSLDEALERHRRNVRGYAMRE